MSGLPLVWGATSQEVTRAYDADSTVGPAPVLMTRGIDVAAPVEVTWRWLCQLAVAPSSYAWIDNGLRRSPRTLTPGADELVLGQRMAKVFVLTSFDVPHQWTGVTSPRGQKLFGAVAMTYAAEPGAAGSRIVCRIAAAAPGRLGIARAHALAWGDLVMIRKQLHVLRDRAEGR
ncbi:hypothetical protein BH11ACT8_BH11ACT8_00180 [soil metagenome]